jgi:hypothetical protein
MIIRPLRKLVDCRIGGRFDAACFIVARRKPASAGPVHPVAPRLLADLAQVPADRGAGSVGVDRIELLSLELADQILEVRTFARSCDLVGAFEGGWAIVHGPS